jgi:hypothetical protein
MPRLPKIRVSYYNDAQWMLRLIHALQRDTKRPEAWRKDMIERLQVLATEFLSAPEGRDV